MCFLVKTVRADGLALYLDVYIKTTMFRIRIDRLNTNESPAQSIYVNAVRYFEKKYLMGAYFRYK